MLTRVAFVDSSIADYKTLVQGLDAGIEVKVIDADRDGWQQVAEMLQGRSDIRALDIFSHGSAGRVYFGSRALDSETLPGYRDVLAEIGSRMAPGGDILLYGCHVAAGAAGQTFIDEFAQATGADVAAAVTLIGSAAQGGQWMLPVRRGDVATTTLAVPEFAGTLATTPPTVTSVFTVGTALATTSTTPAEVLVGDINNDGINDLVIATRGSSNLTYMLGSATGVFGAATTLAGATGLTTTTAWPWRISTMTASSTSLPSTTA